MDPHIGSNEKAKELLVSIHYIQCTTTNYTYILYDHPWLFQFRLSDGIAKPLDTLQSMYKVMVELQGEAMMTAPSRLLAEWFQFV